MTDKEYINSIIASELYLRFVDEQIEETIRIFNSISYEELMEIEGSNPSDASFPKTVKFISFVTNYIAIKVTAAFDSACEQNDSDFEKASSVIKTLSSKAYRIFTEGEMNKFYDDFNSLSDTAKEYITKTYDEELNDLIKLNFERRKAYYISILGSESAAKRLLGIDD